MIRWSHTIGGTAPPVIAGWGLGGVVGVGDGGGGGGGLPPSPLHGADNAF